MLHLKQFQLHWFQWTVLVPWTKCYFRSHSTRELFIETASHGINHQSLLFLSSRGCSEMYRVPVVEYKGSSGDGGSFEYKFPFRSNNNKWQRTSSSPQQSLTASPQPHTPNRAVSLGSSVGKTLSAERLERGAAIPRSVSSDGRPLDTKR